MIQFELSFGIGFFKTPNFILQEWGNPCDLGKPDQKPLTTGHWDFKPSWSKTGDKLVFFRRYVTAPDVWNWKTAICIINADGTGLHQITDAKKLILIRHGQGMEVIDRFGTGGIQVGRGTR